MTWNVVLTWQVTWWVTSTLQPIFEWAQFRVGLISAQHLILANQIQFYTQPIYQNKSFSSQVTISNYCPNYNLISIMLASQHHDTIIMDHIQFFPCIKTSSLALQDQRQQNTPEHIEEIIGNHQQQLRMQRIPFHHLSVLMRVLWQHIWLPMISSLRGFSSILTASSLTF